MSKNSNGLVDKSKKKKSKGEAVDLPWDEQADATPKKKKKKVKDEQPEKKKKKKKADAEAEPVKKKKKKKGGDTVHDVSGRDDNEADDAPKGEKSDMVVGKDDYIIVRKGAKYKLGFAHNPERNACYLEETLNTDEPEVFEYDAKTLIAVLGKDPEIGSAFGVFIEPQRSEVEHTLGKLFYYRKMNKLEKKAFKWALDQAVKVLEEHKLDGVIPVGRIEVRNKKGKYAGHYIIRRKGTEVSDKIVFHPQVMEDAKYNLYVVLHEFAHALWYRKMSEDYHARWLVSYNEHIVVSKAKKSQLEAMLKSLVESQDSLREFAKSFGNEDLEGKALFKEVLSYLKRMHKLSPQDINLLLTHNSALLGEIWPTSASLSESNHPISAYAATKVEEFFAEAVSHFLTGQKLPGKIDKLLQKTIKHIRGN
jgi:hypothetical protein